MTDSPESVETMEVRYQFSGKVERRSVQCSVFSVQFRSGRNALKQSSRTRFPFSERGGVEPQSLGSGFRLAWPYTRPLPEAPWYQMPKPKSCLLNTEY